jgi:leucyl aminopeptidase
LSIRSKNENATHVGFISHFFAEGAMLEAAFTGWTAGQYDIGLYKNSEDVKPRQLSLYTYLQDGSIENAQNGITVGLVQHKVMNLVNTPSSHKTPEVLSNWVKESAAMYNYTATILEKPELFEMGMHALLAVNRGSEHPARCIITQYKHPDATKKITLVGKGVLFDTGGVSIKLAKNMHYMKSDMAGAAAALGTV